MEMTTARESKQAIVASIWEAGASRSTRRGPRRRAFADISNDVKGSATSTRTAGMSEARPLQCFLLLA